MTNNEDENKKFEKYYEVFKTTVKKAEEFIVKYSEDILLKSREQQEQINKSINALEPIFNIKEDCDLDNKQKQRAIQCYNLLNKNNRYCPQFKVQERELRERNNLDHVLNIEDIIMHFCQEMQNFRYMREINFNKYSFYYDDKKCEIIFDNCKNRIFTTVFNFYKNKIQKLEYFDSINTADNFYYKDLYNELYKEIEFNQDSKRDNGDKYSKLWDKYARSLMDMMIHIYQRENKLEEKENYVTFVKRICCEIETYNDEDTNFEKNIESKINEFSVDGVSALQKISLFGSALTHDFLKELACENLVKADYHIEEIFKTIAEKIGEKKLSKTILTRCFIYLCNKYKGEYGDQYTPFYIDKMFWLCSTGNFYADGITIAKITRNNFLKFAGFKLDNYNKK